MASQYSHEVLDEDSAGLGGNGTDALRVDNLTVYYDTPRGPVHAVEDISFSCIPRNVSVWWVSPVPASRLWR